MKIRTDFVTNSSSSSFILKDTKMDDIYKSFENKKDSILAEEWYDEDDYEMFLDWLKWIKPTPIREHNMRDLYSVLGWYEENIYKKVLEKVIDFDSIKWKYHISEVYDQVIEKLSKITLTDEIFEVFAMIMVAECIEHINYDRERNWRDRYRGDKVTEIEISNYLWEVLRYEGPFHDELAYYIMTVDFEKFFDFAVKYADVSMGEIVEVLFEKLFGAKYMYFDDVETHYIIGDTIKESDSCVLGCNHMG